MHAMFKHTAPNRLENEDGASVTTTGRFTKEYREGHHLLKLHYEGGFDEHDIYISSIVINFPVRWEAPYQDEAISDIHLERIKNNLSEAMKVDGGRVIFEYAGEGVV